MAAPARCALFPYLAAPTRSRSGRRSGTTRGRRYIKGALLAAALLSFVTPASAFACEVEEWSLDEAARRAAVIVEADVSLASEAGYVLDVREALKGPMGPTLSIGYEAVGPVSECSGRLDLERGDHVVLALTDPATALATETAAWWVDETGSIREANLVPVPEALTLTQLVFALRRELPDTATEWIGERGGTSSSDHSLLLLAALVGSLAGFDRARRARTDRG